MNSRLSTTESKKVRINPLEAVKSSKMSHWDKATTLKLIDAVKARPALWDQDHCFYNDRYTMEQSWMEIAEMVDKPVVLTKNRWKGLRDVFRAELKRELFAERMNMPRKRRGRWMPYNHMSFLQSQMSVIAEDDNITKKSKVKTEIEDPSFVEVYESEDPLANFVEEAQDVNHPSSLISESLSEEQSLSLTGEDSNQEQQQQQQSNQPDINNHYDDNYHFLVSLAPHMKKLSDERQMLLRMKMQELVYKEVYKKE